MQKEMLSAPSAACLKNLQPNKENQKQSQANDNQIKFIQFFEDLNKQDQKNYTEDLRKLIQYFQTSFNLQDACKKTIQPQSQELNPNVCSKLSYLNILSYVTLQKMKEKFSQVKAQTKLMLDNQKQRNQKLKNMMEKQSKRTQLITTRKKRRADKQRRFQKNI